MPVQLENRLLEFSKRTRDFCKRLKWDLINTEYVRQLIRSSASVTANYIEASDDLGKADEKLKIKTSRREVKEAVCWLHLVLTNQDSSLEKERLLLIDEAQQIKRILSSIILKLDKKL